MRGLRWRYGMMLDSEYVCVHRPRCHHYPHTSIPKGEEVWVHVGEPDWWLDESRHADCIDGLHYYERYGEKVSPYFIDPKAARLWLQAENKAFHGFELKQVERATDQCA
jgi:hypothetical protein